MRRKILIICSAVLLFLLALCLTLYPIISIRYNERHQSQIHAVYQEQIKHSDPSLLEQQRADAIAYNTSLIPGTQLSDAFTQEAMQAAASDYGALLNPHGDEIMGFIRIPKIQVNLPIYHGTNARVLESGIGHLLGTSLPIGGSGTHSILTGHSGMASQKMFSDLPELKLDDVFYLEVLNETLAYQVDQIQTVLPYETDLLQISPDEDLCTLVTCTPIGINTHRLLVRGHRIPYTAPTAEEVENASNRPPEIAAAASTWQQTYLKGVFLGLGFSLCGTVCIVLIHYFRRKFHG